MSTELALIEIKNPLELFSKPNGLDAIIDKIEAEAKAIDRDISTDAGRANIRSVAFKIAKSKTHLDKIGKELTEKQRLEVAAVNTERKRAWERMEAIQEEVRKPLTEWEDAEKNRVAGHEAALTEIAALGEWGGITPSSAQIRDRLELAWPEHETRDWQEFNMRASLARVTVKDSLDKLLAVAVKREDEAAELERLRAAEIARVQAERESQIAAKAKADAESKAVAEAEALAAKVKQESEAAAQRLLAAKEEARAAELRRIAAESKAEADKIAAVEAAALADRQRLEAIAEAERKATEAREADKKHKAKINNEVLAALMEQGFQISEAQAKSIVIAVASGKIPHIKINY